MINSYGTVLDRKTLDRRILLDDSGSHLSRGWLYSTAHIPLDGPLTPYARFGDWFSALALLIAGVWWLAKKERRKRED